MNYTAIEVTLNVLGDTEETTMRELGVRASANNYGLMKQALIERIDKEISKNGFTPMTDIYLSTSMPCGTTVNYKTKDDVPETDMPCPCGDSSHWLIRYKDMRG